MEIENNTRTKRLTTDTVLFAISSFGSKILIFLLTPLYTSVLSTTEYGVADLITTTINFLYPVLTLAIADATLRFVLDKDTPSEDVMMSSMFFTIIATPLLVVCSPMVKRISPDLYEYWGIFIISYLMFNIQNTWANFIKGLNKTKLFALQGIVQTVTIIVCNIYFLLIQKSGLYGYLLSIIIGYTVPSILMLFGAKLYTYFSFKKVNNKVVKEMLKYSIPMIPTLLAWIINTSIDKYMIIAFIGMSASGIYGAAHKIPSIITTILNVFVQAWQISAITNYKAKDEGEYYTKVYGALNVVCIIGCIALFPFSKIMARLLFASSYYSAWQCIPLLTLSAIFSVLSGFLAAAFRAYKKTNELFVSVMVGAILNVGLNFVLIRWIGIIGAATATAFSFLAVWGVRLVTIQSIVKVKVNLINTVLSYGLLVVGAFIITYDLQYSTQIFFAESLVLMVLNYKDLKLLLHLFVKASNSIIHLKKIS